MELRQTLQALVQVSQRFLQALGYLLQDPEHQARELALLARAQAQGQAKAHLALAPALEHQRPEPDLQIHVKAHQGVASNAEAARNKCASPQELQSSKTGC